MFQKFIKNEASFVYRVFTIVTDSLSARVKNKCNQSSKCKKKMEKKEIYVIKNEER